MATERRGGFDAVVVGAGPNGLVAANHLVDSGWSVLVLEASVRFPTYSVGSVARTPATCACRCGGAVNPRSYFMVCRRGTRRRTMRRAMSPVVFPRPKRQCTDRILAFFQFLQTLTAHRSCNASKV